MTDKRYNLALSQDMWDELQKIAMNEGLTVATVLRRFIMLGLIATQADSTLLLRKNGKDKRIVMFPERYEDEETLYLR